MFIAMTLAIAAMVDDPAKDAKPKKEKLICRASETTGTRMAPPPVCKTAAQWEADSELTRQTMEFRQRNKGR